MTNMTHWNLISIYFWALHFRCELLKKFKFHLKKSSLIILETWILGDIRCLKDREQKNSLKFWFFFCHLETIFEQPSGQIKVMSLKLTPFPPFDSRKIVLMMPHVLFIQPFSLSVKRHSNWFPFRSFIVILIHDFVLTRKCS